MRPLLRLPAELTALIAALLSDEDVKSFRFTSRDIEKACFDHFGRRFFRKKGFMITSESLSVLESIAVHDGLSKHVQHIWFNPDCFTFVINSPEFRSKTAIATARYVSDHKVLLNTSRLHGWFDIIFRALPALKTIGMRRGTDHNPYGWERLQYATGTDPRILGPKAGKFVHGLSEPTLLFLAILKALASSRKQLRRMYTDAIEIDKIDSTLFAGSDLKAAFESIWYLEINLIGPMQERSDLSDIAQLDKSTTLGVLLYRLLQSSPDLRELGMTVFQDLKQRHMVPPDPANVQSWRAAYAFRILQGLSDNVKLSNLRRVKLEKICTTEQALTAILRPCSSVLMSLKLRHIHLLSNDKLPNGGAVQAANPWQAFFRFLAHDCCDLEYVLIHSLLFDGTSVRFQQQISTLSASQSGHTDLDTTFIPALGTAPTFVDYDNLTIEELGQEDTRRRMHSLVDGHWSGSRLFTYAMDDDIWHTDTSDEEW